MRDGNLRQDPLTIQRAIDLGSRLRSVEPEKFVQAATSEEVSALSEDLKELYLLQDTFRSKDAVRSLGKLLLLIYKGSYFRGENPDQHSFRLAVEEFRKGINAEIARWKQLVDKKCIDKIKPSHSELVYLSGSRHSRKPRKREFGIHPYNGS